jgi:GT2 family glycosyltransferase
MNLKVLVGSPVSDLYAYCFDEFLESRKSLTYKNHDLFFIDNSKTVEFSKKIKHNSLPVSRIDFIENARERMVESRNLLRKKVLAENYDYFLNLDQDIIPPTDIIERMLKHKKKIITGVYFVYNSQYSNEQSNYPIPTIWVSDEDTSNGVMDGASVRLMHPKETEEAKVVKIVSCGSGCLFIHRSVLEKIKFRYDPFFPYFDDNWFCRDAFYNNFDIFVDTSLKCKHLIKDKPWKWTELKK